MRATYTRERPSRPSDRAVRPPLPSRVERWRSKLRSVTYVCLPHAIGRLEERAGGVERHGADARAGRRRRACTAHGCVRQNRAEGAALATCLMLRGAQLRVRATCAAARAGARPRAPIQARAVVRRFQSTMAALRKVGASSHPLRSLTHVQEDVKKLVSEGRKDGRFLIDVREVPEVEQTGAIPTAVVLPSTCTHIQPVSAHRVASLEDGARHEPRCRAL